MPTATDAMTSAPSTAAGSSAIQPTTAAPPSGCGTSSRRAAWRCSATWMDSEMKRRALCLWTLLLASAVGAAPAGDPLGEVALSSPLGLNAQTLAAAADPAGGALVAWAKSLFDPDAGVRRLDATA